MFDIFTGTEPLAQAPPILPSNLDDLDTRDLGYVSKLLYEGDRPVWDLQPLVDERDMDTFDDPFFGIALPLPEQWVVVTQLNADAHNVHAAARSRWAAVKQKITEQCQAGSLRTLLRPRIASPRIACLQGVREADLIVMILGANYGAVQPNSDLSATHEEWREAKDRRPVVAFVQEGVDRDPRQAEFVREVQDWTGGLFRGGFRNVEDLRGTMTRTIHRLELSTATAAVDPSEMFSRAQSLIPREERNIIRAGGPLVHVAVVGGPAQTILRPVEIERPQLARALLREATYGEEAIFDPEHGSRTTMIDGALHLSQDTGASIVIDERGSLRLSVPIVRGGGMMGALVEENVADVLGRGLGHAASILEHIDDAQRLSRIVVVAGLSSSGMMGWRTRREDEASPNSMTVAHAFHQGERQPVHFQPPDRPRAALSFDRSRMVEDMVTLLRRQWR